MLRNLMLVMALLLIAGLFCPISGETIEEAVCSGILEQVQKAWAANPDGHNAANEWGMTPLIIAIERDQVEIARYLVENGASLDALVYEEHRYTSRGDTLAAKWGRIETCLRLAASMGYPEMTALLMAHSANPNITPADRDKPLAWAERVGLRRPSKGSETFRAARDDDMERLKRALAENPASLDEYDSTGFTPLLLAVFKNLIKTAEYLLAQGAKVDKPENMPRSSAAMSERAETDTSLATRPLHVAADLAFSDMIELLLKAGSNPNARDINHDTPLMKAVRSGCYRCVKALVEHGADPSIADRDGKTPLYWAQHFGHTSIMPLLVTKKQQPSELDAQGLAPIHYAAMEGNVEYMKILLTQGADINTTTRRSGETPLFQAIMGDMKEMFMPGPASGGTWDEQRAKMIRFLISRGADINAKDNRGETPLLRALFRKKWDDAKILIAAGCDVNLANAEGESPLRVAFYREVDNSLITELLKAGADGGPFVINAVVDNKIDLVKLMIKYKVDLNTAGNWGVPIRAAVAKGNWEMCRLLLANGADPKTALLGLHNDSDFSLVETLISIGASVEALDGEGNTPLMKICYEQENSRMVEFLLSKGAKVNLANKEGFTPLLTAIRTDADSIALVLLGFGADPNRAIPDKGLTPLQLAAYDGNAILTRALIERGAKVEAIDKGGLTPLLMAVISPLWSESTPEEVVSELLKSGAKVNAHTPRGKSALHWAAQFCRKEVVNLLLKAGADPKAKTSDNGHTPGELAAYSCCFDVAQLLMPYEAFAKLDVTRKLPVREWDSEDGPPITSDEKALRDEATRDASNIYNIHGIFDDAGD